MQLCLFNKTLNFQDHGSIQAKLAFIFSSGGKSVVPLFAACAAMPRLSKFMPKDPAWHATSYVSVPFLTGEACSTFTAVRVWCVVCGLCVIRKV